LNQNCKPLSLEEYSDLIHLNKPYSPPKIAPEAEKERMSIVDDLVTYLNSESSIEIKTEGEFDSSLYNVKRQKLYSLLTVRKPSPLPSWFYLKLGGFLQRELKEKQITDANNIPRINQSTSKISYKNLDCCALWLGDITSIKCDAIVNAANKWLLGCFRPFHPCIDNAIHSAAGPKLREDCEVIIKRQGCFEGTGWAKITKAYNLPSKYVLHTVGPIFDENSRKCSPSQEEELSNCYISCLNLAHRMSIRSIAFCSISTGIFGFPIISATQIALQTVEKWIEKNSDAFDLIVFNVFSKEDYNTYESVLKGE
jgi:O-acetyl-ADP-ribose deacetylase (regulator of RNase III)